jgi:hypothetical protein
MPRKSVPKAKAAPVQFHKRFDELERRRKLLLAQLKMLGASATKYPAYRNALTLLNAKFRRASLVQRGAILEAAAWLIDLLEKLPTL